MIELIWDDSFNTRLVQYNIIWDKLHEKKRINLLGAYEKGLKESLAWAIMS